MGYNINAADQYAMRSGRNLKTIEEQELEMFKTDEQGEFVYNNKETRAWNSIHPKHGERFHGRMTPQIYVVQSIEPIFVHGDGRTERRAYGIFCTYEDACNFIKNTGLTTDDVDIIPCHKKDFRKSIWGWDVDGL